MSNWQRKNGVLVNPNNDAFVEFITNRERVAKAQQAQLDLENKLSESQITISVLMQRLEALEQRVGETNAKE